MDGALPFLLYQIPEAFLLILSALGLLGLRIRPGRLALAGLGLGILTEVSRRLFFSRGLLHTPIILLGLIIALILSHRLSFATAVTGCFLSYFLLKMGETIIVLPVMQWSKISLQDALSDPWLHIAFGWLSACFLVLATLISHFGHLALIRPPEARSDIQKG